MNKLSEEMQTWDEFYSELKVEEIIEILNNLQYDLDNLLIDTSDLKYAEKFSIAIERNTKPI